ncbi:helix-turn-helix transcriptional regulator [Nocardioides sp.]|uniref:helix-turn-helix transcriptional regulator n=1 Tax=Nocardioides sp. TaxID=35761 RepID=UPI002EDAFA68
MTDLLPLAPGHPDQLSARHDIMGLMPPQHVLVGREAELAELTALLGIPADSAAGAASGSHVLLSGDAGVGKTRLLVELTETAASAGWQVYVGHCLDFGDSALPYLPFSEVLARVAAARADVVDRVAGDYPALTRLQPGRRVLAAGETHEGSIDRGSLLDAVRGLLEALAEDGPLLLVVEDAHWADRSTRDLLSFLFARPFHGPVRIVTSYRSDDLHRRHPLRPQVAEWTRLGSVERVSLGPLSEAAVRALVGAIAPQPVPEADLAAIVARAEGNAFFVEELVASAGGSDQLPWSLADVLLVRLDRLDDGSREAVRTAAVAGREVSHELLAHVTGLPAASLDDALRRAVEMNVLTVGGAGRYAFRHALLAEAVYDDLLPGERARLHSKYVAALLDPATSGRGTAAELARHALLARDLDTAYAASVRAGDEALTVGGPDEAAQHYQQALELLAARDAAPVAEVVALTAKAVEALAASGQPVRAAALAAERLDRLPPDVAPSDRALLLIARAEALYVTEAGDDPVRLATAAFELVPDDDSALRARVLSSYARIAAGFGQYAEAEQAGLEALALAERLNHPELVSEVVTTLSGLKKTGPKEALRAALGDAVDRAEAAGAVAASVRGRFLLGRSFQDHGEFDEAVRWFRSGRERALAAGIPWAPYALECGAQLISTLVLLGRWDEALDLADTRQAPPVAAAELEVHRLTIEQARGADVSDAALRLRPFWHLEGIITIHAASLEFVEAARRGDARGVVAVYEEAVAALAMMWHEWFDARLRLAAQAIDALNAVLPTLPAAARSEVLQDVERLAAEGQRVVARKTDPAGQPGQWGPEGRAWGERLTAEVLRARWLAGGKRPPDAAGLCAAWRATESAFETLGHAHELAHVRVVLAGVLRASGDASWRSIADEARAAATRLGARPLVHELDGLGAPAAREPGASETLTPREREILELVAAGRSNGEIGKLLFISTKTVSVHVSNILGKLGAAGRTEAAAIARRQGLLG